jgi:AcrR family transcriptional regulator
VGERVRDELVRDEHVRYRGRMTASPRSRRERAAKPALTREGIVAAAVAILRAEGLRKVTMRRLAQELDTGPASLYVYVRNTDELHAAVLDELLGTVGPAPAEGGWRERLERVLTDYTAMLMAHPSLARSALTARPSGPNYLRLIETLLGLLQGDRRRARGRGLTRRVAGPDPGPARGARRDPPAHRRHRRRPAVRLPRGPPVLGLADPDQRHRAHRRTRLSARRPP